MSDWINIAYYVLDSTETTVNSIGAGTKPSITLSIDYSLRTESDEQLQYETGEIIYLEPL